jgi:hypothetical protein
MARDLRAAKLSRSDASVIVADAQRRRGVAKVGDWI